jgi:flagellar biogenesis protein FliO
MFRLSPRAVQTGVAALASAVFLTSVSPALAQGSEPNAAPDQAQSVPPAPRPSDTERHLGLPKAAPSHPTAAKPGAIAGDAFKTVLSLGGVLALVGGAAFVLKRLARSHGGLRGAAGPGGRAPAGVLEVLGRYPLSRGQSLMLLKLDRRMLLLSQSAGGRLGGTSLTTLCEITDPEEIASILVKVRDEEGDSLARRFQSVLGKADRVTADAVSEADSGRRTTTNDSGDSAELWAQPKSLPPPDQGFGLLQSDRLAPRSRPETGADSLRRRLGSLRRLGDDQGGGGL